MDTLVRLLTHPVVMVGLGGALGANLRYGVGLASARWLGVGFPWGTLAVNVLGSCLLGFLTVWLAEPLGPSRRAWRLFLAVGFCGGFTTFSTFSAETLALMRSGRSGLAVVYVGVSVGAGLLALWLAVRFAEEAD